MKQAIFEITENKKIAKDTFRMVIATDVDVDIKPGQFVDIKIDGFTLRRPISVSYAEDNRITLIYKTAGQGTEKLSDMKKGEKLDVLYGLGNGFDISKSGENPLLIGGGIGTAPMHLLAKRLLDDGKKVKCIMGFVSADEVVLQEDLSELGAEVKVATEDGSLGIKGFVTDLMEDEHTYIYVCGPKKMLKAVHDKWEGAGEYSFEERMGCGFGACMGCSCKTKNGNKRICKEGPVLTGEEIIWED